MTNLEELIIKFDLILSRNCNSSFTYNEINQLVEQVTNDKIMQHECLNFFVKYNILQKNDYNYYYLFDKCYRYNPYKNYVKIKNLIETDLCNKIDFTNFNL